MKKSAMIFWALIVVAILTVITIYGFNYSKKHPYLKQEQIIIKASKKYIKNYKGIKPVGDTKLVINIRDLEKEGYIKKTKFKELGCEGKVTVKYKHFEYYYYPKIKCD